MKNWIIIVITLLLTALYVMSVRQALGGLRYLHLRLELCRPAGPLLPISAAEG